MNKGTYGYPLPPNAPTRVAPPEWRSCKAFFNAGTYTGEIVPQNVYQIGVAVIGGGGNGNPSVYISPPGVGGAGGGGGGEKTN